MTEKSTINKLDSKVTESGPSELVLVKLSAQGFSDIQSVSTHATNFILFATKNGKLYFIKVYKNDNAVGDTFGKRATTEAACYEHLPAELLLDFVNSDLQNGFLVLAKAELFPIEKTKESIQKLIDLFVQKILAVDASFLPETSFEEYERTSEKAVTLHELGIIQKGNLVGELFTKNRPAIEEAQRVFSHHDFNFLNIKQVEDRVVIFDFEHARQDAALYDLATLYIDLDDDVDLQKYFIDETSKHGLYDQKLFMVMLVRRVTNVVYGLRDKTDAPYYIRCKKILERILDSIN